MFRKSTIKKMNPTARKLAKNLNEIEKYTKRTIKLIDEVNRLELDSLALFNRTNAQKGRDFIDDSMSKKVAQDIKFQ